MSAPQYVGCLESPALSTDIWAMSQNNATQDLTSCFRFCLSRGNYKFLSLQGGTCSCSTSLVPQFKEAPNERCSTICPGTPNQICGGPVVESVYRIEPNATSTSSSTQNPPSTSRPPPPPANENPTKSPASSLDTSRATRDSQSVPLIVGVVLGAAILASLALLFLFRRNRQKKGLPSSYLPSKDSSFSGPTFLHSSNRSSISSLPESRISPAPMTDIESSNPLSPSSSQSYHHSTSLSPNVTQFISTSSEPPSPQKRDPSDIPTFAKSLSNLQSGSLYYCCYSYIPTLPDELLVSVNDIIKVTNIYDDGWGDGYNLSRPSDPPTEGAFPLVCLIANSHDATSSTTSSLFVSESLHNPDANVVPPSIIQPLERRSSQSRRDRPGFSTL